MPWFTLMFSSNSCIVLAPTFRSLIHLELIFTGGVTYWSSSVLLPLDYPPVPGTFVEKLIPHSIMLASLSKSIAHSSF